MAIDWLAIKNDYINGHGSYRKLAEKYGVSFNTLKDRAVKERWSAERGEQHHKTTTKTQQKTSEKISEVLSDEAAAKVRIRAKLIRMAEKWVDSQGETISDTGDYRRIVQSCVELGIMGVNETEDMEDDGLLDALSSNAEMVFADGDDSGMLPDEPEEPDKAE